MEILIKRSKLEELRPYHRDGEGTEVMLISSPGLMNSPVVVLKCCKTFDELEDLLLGLKSVFFALNVELYRDKFYQGEDVRLPTVFLYSPGSSGENSEKDGKSVYNLFDLRTGEVRFSNVVDVDYEQIIILRADEYCDDTNGLTAPSVFFERLNDIYMYQIYFPEIGGEVMMVPFPNVVELVDFSESPEDGFISYRINLEGKSEIYRMNGYNLPKTLMEAADKLGLDSALEDDEIYFSPKF